MNTSAICEPCCVNTISGDCPDASDTNTSCALAAEVDQLMAGEPGLLRELLGRLRSNIVTLCDPREMLIRLLLGCDTALHGLVGQFRLPRYICLCPRCLVEPQCRPLPTDFERRGTLGRCLRDDAKLLRRLHKTIDFVLGLIDAFGLGDDGQAGDGLVHFHFVVRPFAALKPASSLRITRLTPSASVALAWSASFGSSSLRRFSMPHRHHQPCG